MLTALFSPIIAGALNMLTQILLVVVEFILNFISTVLHSALMFFAKEIMGLFKIDATIFETTHVMGKIISTYGSAFRALGFSILILIASWQIFKGFFSFMSLSTEPEEAWKIGVKCILFGILVLESDQICKLILNLFDAIMAGFNVEMSLKEFKIGDRFEQSMNFVKALPQDTSFMGILTDVLKFILPIGSIQQIIDIDILLIQSVFLLVFDIKILGIAIDLSEKYIKMVILIIIAPLSFACGVAKATGQIFNAWIKSFTGLLVSVAMKYGLLALFTHMVNEGMFSANSLGETIKSSILMIGIASLINQSDALVGELGFNAGRTTAGASGVLGKPLMAGVNMANQYGQAKLLAKAKAGNGGTGGSGDGGGPGASVNL